MKIRKLAVLLLAALTALSGCGGNAGEEASPSGGDAAMGRFVEQDVKLPENLTFVNNFEQSPDGELFITAGAMTPVVYSSKDGGNSWTKTELPWLEELNKTDDIYGSARTPSGGMVVIHCKRWNEEEGAAMSDEEAEEYYSLKLTVADAEGNAREMKFPDFETDATPQWLLVTENGKLITMAYYTANVWNLENLEHCYDINTEQTAPVSGAMVMDDQLVLALGNTLKFYDLETGEERDTREVPGSFYDMLDEVNFSTTSIQWRPLSPSPSGEKAFYYCNRSGIYRQSFDGTLNERLADGELCSLSVPSLQCYGFTALQDSSFLVISYDRTNFWLKRYVYDETVQSSPDTELTVYSLKQNDTVRQAMGKFQQENPNVRVRFTAAAEDSTGTERSDLLRTLNTELLAGQGPDVLVLDNLPLESYAEKGVLLNLKDLVQSKTDSGEWLDKAAAYRQEDGAVYAVPARFSAPVMLTDPEQAESLHNLKEIADWLTQASAANPDQYPIWNTPSEPEYLMKEWYNACAPAWIREDGTIDETIFSEFLVNINMISGLKERSKDDFSGERPENWRVDLSFHPISWGAKGFPMVAGTLSDVNDAATMIEVIREDRDGRILPLAGQASGVFIPGCILGINAQSSLKDLAQAFVETAFSQEIQSVPLGDGFPVNKESFYALVKEPGGEGDYEWKYGYSDPLTDELKIYVVPWPPAGELNAVLTMLDNLKIPSPEDEETLQIITDETAGYFSGNRSLEETVTSVAGKLQLRLSESK